MSYIMQGTRVDTNDRAMQFKKSRNWKNLNIEHGMDFCILFYFILFQTRVNFSLGSVSNFKIHFISIFKRSFPASFCSGVRCRTAKLNYFLSPGVAKEHIGHQLPALK